MNSMISVAQMRNMTRLDEIERVERDFNLNTKDASIKKLVSLHAGIDRIVRLLQMAQISCGYKKSSDSDWRMYIENMV